MTRRRAREPRVGQGRAPVWGTTSTPRQQPDDPRPPTDREPGTRPDGEAAPPQTIDPGAHGTEGEDAPPPVAPNTDATGF